MSDNLRITALAFALEHIEKKGSGDVVLTATEFLGFLEGTATPAAVEAPAAAPKAKRGKVAIAAETSPATTAPAAPVAESAPATATAETITDKETDDLFGEEPAAEPVVEKVKEATIEDVRAKLVEVQTKLKSKDKAVALLKAVAGGPTLSALKKEDYAKLIGKCDAAVKAAA